MFLGKAIFFFFLNFDLKCVIEKCVSCFLVYLFSGGEGVLIKNCKKMCLCGGAKNCIVTCEKCIY